MVKTQSHGTTWLIWGNYEFFSVKEVGVGDAGGIEKDIDGLCG